MAHLSGPSVEKSCARRALGGGLGEGRTAAPTDIVTDVSRRQGERGSRYQTEIEAAVRSSALVFRADDVEASVTAALRLWWTSHLRGRRFGQLVQQARAATQERISVGGVERGEAGRRQAMPYFFAVLRDLVSQHVDDHTHADK
jgi:hypothetical protein